MSVILKISIGHAAKELGVSIPTLRRWEAEGKIHSARTPHGHRRYDLTQLRGLKPCEASKTNRPILCYARASHDQKVDLLRQVSLLETFCAGSGWTQEIMQDLGSGLNYNKKGLQQLIKRICEGSIGRMVLTNKDRLLRFGSELVFSLCEIFSVEVVMINQGEQPLSFEEELTQDVLEIITVFSARLYGSRSRENHRLVETLREAAEQV
jgi:putative resolvase